jgi:hypothetical protein
VSNSFTAHLGRDGPQSVSAPETFETAEGFTVYLRNHGTPLHVHVRLDDSLGEIAEVLDPNRYVEEGSTRRVRVEVENTDRPVEGQVEVVTGYGTETEHVAVTITDPSTVETDIPVDEGLSRRGASSNLSGGGSGLSGGGSGLSGGGSGLSGGGSGLSGGGSGQLVRNAVLGGTILLVVVVAVVIEEPLVIIGGLLALVGVMLAGYLVEG